MKIRISPTLAQVLGCRHQGGYPTTPREVYRQLVRQRDGVKGPRMTMSLASGDLTQKDE